MPDKTCLILSLILSGEYLGKERGTSLIKTKYLVKSDFFVKGQFGDGSVLNNEVLYCTSNGESKRESECWQIIYPRQLQMLDPTEWVRLRESRV